MAKKELSKYRITWAIFRPLRGVVTLSDQRAINGRHATTWKGTRILEVHFSDLQAAKKWLLHFDESKLCKPYRVTLVSDAQFGKADPMRGIYADDLATAKQKADAVILGKYYESR